MPRRKNDRPADAAGVDDIVFYQGPRRGNQKTSNVTLTHCGAILVGALLTDRLDAAMRYVRIGYGASSGRLVLEPIADRCPSAAKIQRRKSGVQVAALVHLRYHGLLPARRASYEGIWTGNRIVAFIARPDKTQADVKVDADNKQSADLQGDLCVTCPSYRPTIGNRLFGTCAKVGAKNYGKIMKAADRRCDRPSRSSPQSRAPAKKDSRKGPWPKVRCPHCSAEVPLTGRGLYPHDTAGVLYLAGRGNRDDRCPGMRTLRDSPCPVPGSHRRGVLDDD